ncbi:MAG: amidohydrolase family protein [Acidobacteriota bacterium]
MITLRARWVVPVTSMIIEDGAIVISKDRIVDLGPADRIFKRYRSIRKDLGAAILLPALVNCHTHLELSHLKGRVKTRTGFVEWIGSLIRMREQDDEKEVIKRTKEAIDRMYRSGTSSVGEVSNSLVTMKALSESRLRGIIFKEIFALRDEDALRCFTKALEEMQEFKTLFGKSGRFRFSITAHAPHTVSPVLFRMVRQFQRMSDSIISVHLAESQDEKKLIESGRGKLKDYLIEKSFWNYGWKVPGVSPVKYLDRLGILSGRMLAIHCVQVSAHDMDILRKRKVSVVVCPRSNRRLKTGKAPIARILSAGINVALGTDSLASNSDLSIFQEMKFLGKEFPDVKPDEILRMATINGAKALGLGKELGSIEKGKTADLIAIDIRGMKKQDDPFGILLSSPNPARVFRPLPSDQR